MRAYTAFDEEKHSASASFPDWAGEGFITEPQRHLLGSGAECPLRRTNAFLRAVLFLYAWRMAPPRHGLSSTFFLGPVCSSTTNQGLFSPHSCIELRGREFA